MGIEEPRYGGVGCECLRDSGAFPCAVCRNVVGASNTIKCLQCTHWVHKRCSGIISRAELLQTKTMFAQGVVEVLVQLMTQVDIDVEASFCYLG